MILRGEVYEARLDPTEGSEQAGSRPVIIISRNAINAHSSIILAIPCSTYRGRHIYPSQTLLRAPEGGLADDSIAMAEQLRVLSQSRLLRRRGVLSADALARVERALLIACDLPGQTP
jgi:mRNA interferase MazF